MPLFLQILSPSIAYSVLNNGYPSMMKANSRLVLAVAALLLISGCSQRSIPQVTPSSTPTVTSTASIPQATPSSTATVTSTASFDRSAVVNEATAYLQSFLTSWQKNGLYAAGQKYLDPSQRANHQTQGDLVLRSGTVMSTQPGEWVSADHFTVQAELDLRFSKEDAVAWGNGVNTRFVTFVRSSASAPYQMMFATGP